MNNSGGSQIYINKAMAGKASGYVRVSKMPYNNLHAHSMVAGTKHGGMTQPTRIMLQQASSINAVN